jgi:hypothetical protein
VPQNGLEVLRFAQVDRHDAVKGGGSNWSSLSLSLSLTRVHDAMHDQHDD